MSRRPLRFPFRLPRRVVQGLFAANAFVALVLGGWFVAQPSARQHEVQQLMRNAWARDKHVTALEVAWDIWQLYYGSGAKGAVAAGDKSIVYGGAPRVRDETSTGAVRVLTNRGYVVGYSDARGNPLWAAYRVQDLASIPRAPHRPEKFEIDRRTAARIAPEDYAGSGFDRGHLAPNYAIATHYGTAAQRETFLMSNVTPQRHGLNAGLWRELEERIATNYPARYQEVWVLTGPIFGPSPRTLRHGVAIPEAFFLIIVDEHEGKLRTLALIVPQDAPAHADPANYLTTIDEIQQRTGLDFLSELDDAAEREVESARASRLW